jgi:hypothetical protein
MSEPRATFDVKAQWSALVATGELVLAAKKARDLSMLVYGNTLAGASFEILYQTAQGLLREQGGLFRARANDPDPEVRAFVRLALERIHGPARRVPEEEEAR